MRYIESAIIVCGIVLCVALLSMFFWAQCHPEAGVVPVDGTVRGPSR